MSRYRKLLDAAKDVDSFTRIVLERYARLHRRLPLNVDEDSAHSLRPTSSLDDPRLLSGHDLTTLQGKVCPMAVPRWGRGGGQASNRG